MREGRGQRRRFRLESGTKDGGAFRRDPKLDLTHASKVGSGGKMGYYWQLFAGLGLFVTFVGIFFRGPGYAFVIPYLEFFTIGTPGLHFAL